MLVEIYYGSQLVTSLVTPPAEGSSGLLDDAPVKERFRSRPLPGWDEVATRWPEGGRFPSFIIIDQTA